MSLRVVNAALSEVGLVSHQTESFNDFIARRIQLTFDSHGSVEVPLDTSPNSEIGARLKFHQIELGDCVIVEADGYSRIISPAEARHRNLTYARPLYAHVTGEFRYAATEEFKPYASRVLVGQIPIMVKSSTCVLSKISDDSLRSLDECTDDVGGYFIVQSTGSSEKNILAQERASSNRAFVFTKDEASASVRSTYVLEIRSSDLWSTRVQMCSFKLTTEKFGSTVKLVCSLPFCREEMPVMTLLRAMGSVDIEAEIGHTSLAVKRMLKLIALDSSTPATRDAALAAIGERMGGLTHGASPRERANAAFVRDFCIHIDAATSLAANDEALIATKLQFVTHSIDLLLRTVAGERPPDDRDHVGNKRFDLAGPLLGGLFRVAFLGMRSDLVKSLQKILDKHQEFTVEKVIDSGRISRLMRTALATGNFSNRIGPGGGRMGVTQVLNRLNRLAMLSQLRRLNAPTVRDGKTSKPRQLHNTQFGYICAAETPEGQQVGLVKNLALLTRVTTFTPPGAVVSYVRAHMPFAAVPGSLQGATCAHLIVDGFWMADFAEWKPVVAELRARRRESVLSGDISVSYLARDRCILVFCDEGRLTRPLFVSVGGRIETGDDTEESFASLLARGAVEYVDALEEESLLIAFAPADLTEEHTHCEIHPSTMLGIAATSIPFSHHNQAPRNVYQAAMGKQSVGLPMSNFAQRMDVKTNVLYYPQRAICESASSACDDLSQCIILAISTYSGYNQEDSLVLNASSVDRGLFRSFVLKTFTVEANRHQLHGREQFEVPTRATTAGMQRANYSKLEPDGIVAVGVRVMDGDIIVGKTSPNTGGGDGLQRRDASLKIRGSEGGIVDAVMRTTNEAGNELVKVRIRTVVLPEIGNKYASRHAQKGTCGMLLRQEDMPYTSEGIVPCAIFNPHGVPSRMTVGHLLEMVASKSAAVSGKSKIPATAFETTDTTAYSAELAKFGYHPLGYERMYDPRTGLRQKEHTFLGIINYQVLKHIVCDKIHARGARGPNASLTRQPVEGRSRLGGLRVGEMERDALLSHGASATTLQLLRDQSDPWEVAVCETCNNIGFIHKVNGACCLDKKCLAKNVSVVKIPYATNLMISEMRACGVSMKFTLK